MGETGEGSGENGGGNWECGTPLSTPSKGDFNFSFTKKKCASLFVATWLLAWSEKQYKS